MTKRVSNMCIENLHRLDDLAFFLSMVESHHIYV